MCPKAELVWKQQPRAKLPINLAVYVSVQTCSVYESITLHHKRLSINFLFLKQIEISLAASNIKV